MRKNGFTLIELLAVIVILAIIALIATPIILGIINDAREESNERSVELYASAVRNGIAAYQLRTGNEVLPGTYNETNKLPFEVEYDGKVDCTSVIISEEGKVSLEGCTVNGGTKEYNYGIEAEPLVAKVCTIEKQDASKYSVGDVVTCTLSESTDKFYIIEEQPLTATTIQMLTEKNIHTTEYRQSDNAGTVIFSNTDYWVSENTSIVYAYSDSSLLYPIVEGYVSYLNTKLSEATGALLTYSQATSLGCDETKLTCGPDQGYGASKDPGYSWLYSTDYWTGYATGNMDMVYYLSGNGYYIRGPYSGSYNTYGVRPVITISTSDIQ